MITAKVETIPLGFAIAYYRDEERQGFLSDGPETLFTFAARFRAQEYAGLFDARWRAIDARDMFGATDINRQMREHRASHARIWPIFPTTATVAA
jgi:hypothetical protein